MTSVGSVPSGRRIDQFDVIAFDADDTLWRSEDSFDHAEHRFAQLVSPYVPSGVDVDAALRATEKADLSVTGYGVKAFTLSMIRAAITVTDGAVPVQVIAELGDLGRSMLTEPVHLLADVPEVLTEVSRRVQGRAHHQGRPRPPDPQGDHVGHRAPLLRGRDRAGEGRRDVHQAARPVRRAAERFCMVGNSVRSDILPVMAIGGHAVHIPYHLTWELERVDDHDEDVIELASIAELPAWLGLR